MSLIFDYKGLYKNQPYYEKQLLRLKYFPNNIAELVKSDGESLLYIEQEYQERHTDYENVFNLLPNNYVKLPLEEQLFIYSERLNND